MDHIFSTSLAQSIVDSVKNIVERDLNIIDQNGIIIASTDSSRIGTFHQAGYEVINSSESKSVDSDALYSGTKKGINYPIRVNDRTIGVIGITGHPDEVEKYGFLITKITEIFIKEAQLEHQIKTKQQMIRNAITSLIYNDAGNKSNILQVLNIDSSQKYTVMMIRFPSSSVKTAENDIKSFFAEMSVTIYTYLYPNEFIAFLNEMQYKAILINYTKFDTVFGSSIKAGIGSLVSILSIHNSYQYAKTALDYAVKNHKSITFAEDLNIQILLESIDPTVKSDFKHKILSQLTPEDIQLLEVYFQHNFSLKETAEMLFLHKNTIQYRLSSIQKKTNLDARIFHDAVVLYLAISLS
jgi:carbohydrate diacid regulator